VTELGILSYENADPFADSSTDRRRKAAPVRCYRRGMRCAAMLCSTLLVATAAAGCKKESAPKAKEAPVTAGAVQADGARRIDVEAGMEGYRPERIVGKPGEKLLLVFKRTAEGECLAQLKSPDGKVHELPLGTPVEVPITVPASGELAFACGMDMYKGVIVAQPAG
jgi:hypothetical protein